MRILLIHDGSSYSDTATDTLEALRLPPQTEVTVMTVVPEHSFLGGITIEKLRGIDSIKKQTQEEEAIKLLSGPVQLLRESGLKVESLVRWGNPVREVLNEAGEREVSLIVMGTKGMTNYPAFRLGSVCQNVVKHARTNVLIARKKTVSADKLQQSAHLPITIDRVLFATDGSKYADIAAEFLLDLPLPKQSQVTVLTVLQSYVDTMMRVPTLEPMVYKDMLADVQAAEDAEAQKIISRSIEQFKLKGYQTSSMVMKGAVGESILKAAGEYDPDIISVGARGLSGIESFFMGSVSERIVRHAPCSVLVAKSSNK